MTNERPERLGNVECSKCRHFNGGILSQEDGLTSEQINDLINNIISLCSRNPALLAIVVLDGLININLKGKEATILDSHCPYYQPKLHRPNRPVSRNSAPLRHHTDTSIIYSDPTSDDEYVGYAANLPEPYGF